ncbi:MAG: hypothetical protein ACKVZH_06665 [Blastocatellia bacterium]
MPRREIIEVIIHSQRQPGDDESDVAFQRVQLGLEYCGFIFRAIGSLHVANRAAVEDPQPPNVWDHLRDFDDELCALARVGDAFAGFAEEQFGDFVQKYVDASPVTAQNSTQLAAVNT